LPPPVGTVSVNSPGLPFRSRANMGEDCSTQIVEFTAASIQLRHMHLETREEIVETIL
jgi:hypothetical protein